LFQTLGLEKFRHGTSTVTRVVNLVRPTTVGSITLSDHLCDAVHRAAASVGKLYE